MLILVIPILGLLKNYVKYKKISFFLFLRTPIICYTIKYIYFIVKQKNLSDLQLIFLERCFMFLYKIIYSLITNSYIKKKEKYKIKYNLEYLEDSDEDID